MRKLICALTLCISFAFAADVSGTWQVSWRPARARAPDPRLAADRGTTHGHIQEPDFWEQKITGSVKGNAIEFGFEARRRREDQDPLQGHHRERHCHEGNRCLRGLRRQGYLDRGQDVTVESER